MRRFTQEEIRILQEEYANTRTETLAKKMKRSVSSLYAKVHTLGLSKDEDFLRKEASRIMKEGKRKTLFKKGHIPFTKGKKQSDYMSPEAIERTKATRFQKGQKVHSEKYNGHISIRKDKRGIYYLFIRIAKRKYIPYHRHIWIQKYGPIPKGSNVIFKDKNTANLKLENLILLSNAELMKRNLLHDYPKSLQALMQLKAVLTRQINKDEK